MKETKQVRFCGQGGQGILLAGSLFGSAALEEWEFVTESTSYGASVSGGLCAADVVVSHEPITYPKVVQADVLIAMAQRSYDTNIGLANPGGVVFYDDTLQKKEIPGLRQVAVPATRLAVTELGSPMVTNMIMLGVISSATGFIARDTLHKIIEKEVAERFWKLNKAAIDVGVNFNLS